MNWPLRKLTCCGALLLTMATALATASCADDDPPAAATLAGGDVLSPADELAILQTIARMNHAIDARAWDDYTTFYVEGGVLESGPGGASRGRAEIRAYLEAQAPFISTKRHAATNVVVRGAGGRAEADSYLLVFERDSALRLDGTALVNDAFERQPDGRWLVSRHTVGIDPATQAAFSQGGPPPGAQAAP